MDPRLVNALDPTRRPPDGQRPPPLAGESFGGPRATPALAPKPDIARYELDDSADADIAGVDLDQIGWLQERLDDDPAGLVAELDRFADGRVREAELRRALNIARGYLESTDTALPVLEAAEAHSRARRMPAGFTFEDYDPATREVLPDVEDFETSADTPRWVLAFLAAKTRMALKKRAPFRTHGGSERRSLLYEQPARATTIALLGDFGNGLAASHYNALHIRKLKPDHLIYLGDVYYAGTSSEFATFVAPQIEPLLATTNVMMLNANHEMHSKGYPYFSYLDYRLKKGGPQCQQASYFCLRFGKALQLVGIDTDYFGESRFQSHPQGPWLEAVLKDGRARGAVNVLLSPDEPYTYGQPQPDALLDQLAPIVPLVDLWIWGNDHYCGLFDMTDRLPVGTCLGHGGYPYLRSEYRVDERVELVPSVARPLFIESRSRYDGFDIRPECGNNGFAVMHFDPGPNGTSSELTLEYRDWRNRLRCTAHFARMASGRYGVRELRAEP